jgi:hypothetical protein
LCRSKGILLSGHNFISTQKYFKKSNIKKIIVYLVVVFSCKLISVHFEMVLALLQVNVPQKEALLVETVHLGKFYNANLKCSKQFFIKRI